MTTIKLDATGLNCPLPILRAKKMLKTMDEGQLLRIIASDPGSVKDFESFSDQTENILLDSSENGGKYEFLIRKPYTTPCSELDATGLNCPLPIIRAKKQLKTIERGSVLRIIATDPGTVKDFQSFSDQSGNKLLESTERGGTYEFLLRKC